MRSRPCAPGCASARPAAAASHRASRQQPSRGWSGAATATQDSQPCKMRSQQLRRARSHRQQHNQCTRPVWQPPRRGERAAAARPAGSRAAAATEAAPAAASARHPSGRRLAASCGGAVPQWAWRGRRLGWPRPRPRTGCPRCGNAATPPARRSRRLCPSRGRAAVCAARHRAARGRHRAPAGPASSASLHRSGTKLRSGTCPRAAGLSWVSKNHPWTWRSASDAAPPRPHSPRLQGQRFETRDRFCPSHRRVHLTQQMSAKT